MNHANLTARYRPQAFAEIAGQETVRAILSRAAAEDKIAPAYLFSGTRGVGKTTVARIFAKALNCVAAPAAEPCNTCDRCRQITMGTAVDVVEIDGASNRGIDDVRKLKEVVGYAPMEGRYRVFIIDEAHMLSRDAFNALLKTLEEPPAHATFILATTEPHKFPATIISRCQHYVFKGLSEKGLQDHLASVLGKEGIAFEDSAVRLIARRAAGSVRDAMSLLGQVLALGGEALTEEDTRTVLGLAGQELFFNLFRTLRDGDSVAVTRLVADMLGSGLDLGFFLREMAQCWRNLFILAQSGERAVQALDIPAGEAERWREEAGAFSLAHIHAAWQMTIDGQRRVLTSLEPALALELLLLNIAMLPRLLPLEELSRRGLPGQPPAGAPPSGIPQPPRGGASTSGPASPPAGGGAGPASRSSATQSVTADSDSGRQTPAGGNRPVAESQPFQADGQSAQSPEQNGTVSTRPVAAPIGSPAPPDECRQASGPAGDGEPAQKKDVGSDSVSESFQAPQDVSWSAFMRFCRQRQDLSADFGGMLRTMTGEWRDGILSVTPGSQFCADRLTRGDSGSRLESLAREYYGSGTSMRVLPPPRVKTADEIRDEIRTSPAVDLLEKELGARLIDFGVAPANGTGQQGFSDDAAGPLQ